MVFELIYHTCSPKYRRGGDIEDPLHTDGTNMDPDNYDTELPEDVLRLVRAHQREHSTGSGFKWPYSTHKSLHSAACNGILAGLVGITAGERYIGKIDALPHGRTCISDREAGRTQPCTAVLADGLSERGSCLGCPQLAIEHHQCDTIETEPSTRENANARGVKPLNIPIRLADHLNVTMPPR